MLIMKAVGVNNQNEWFFVNRTGLCLGPYGGPTEEGGGSHERDPLIINADVFPQVSVDKHHAVSALRAPRWCQDPSHGHPQP